MSQETAAPNNANGNGAGKAGGKPAPRTILWLLVCSAGSWLIYQPFKEALMLLPSARPSRMHEVFPWVLDVTDKTLAVIQFNTGGRLGEMYFLGFCVVLFAIYALMLRLARGRIGDGAQWALFAGGALCLVALLFSPVMLSTDVYAYAFYGRVLSVHGSSPYHPDPSVFSDPYYDLFHRQSELSLYGPLWTLISAWITRMTGDNVGLTVLVFRAVSAFSAIGAAGLIWRCLRIYAPERAAQGLVMFLWNPMVMIEAGVSGHNDFTMAALAALAVWLHLKGARAGTAMALTFSALVKFITGMLVPLYILMVLREMKYGRHRLRFVLLAAAGIASAAVMVLVPAHVQILPGKGKANVPAQSEATSPAFYMNNFHELAFKGLRRLLGENAEPLMMPTDGTLETWWAVADKDTVLRSTPSPAGLQVAGIAKGTKLIVIAPTLIPWLRVYDAASGKRGYVDKDDMSHLKDTTDLPSDPELARLELPVAQWPTVVMANRVIRIVTWGLFAAFGLLAAWKTKDFGSFLVWSGAALLASYFLVITQMWPWYITWALVFGALKPGRLPARLAVLLSAGVLSYYVTLDYEGGANAWVYAVRSIPAMLAPLAVFLVTLAWGRGRGRIVV